MASISDKPETREQRQPDWGLDWQEVGGQAAAMRHDQAEPESGGLLGAVSEWRDSRRMRRGLRRGSTGRSIAGTGIASLRELGDRVDDWRVDHRAKRYGGRATGRKRALRMAALVSLVSVVVAAGAVLTGGDGSSPRATDVATAASAATPADAASKRKEAAAQRAADLRKKRALAQRKSRAAGLRKKRAVALRAKRAAALRARRRAARKPAATAPKAAVRDATPAPVTSPAPKPVSRAPARPAPKPAPAPRPKPKPKPKGQSFDQGG